jgi:hypothetical protein
MRASEISVWATITVLGCAESHERPDAAGSDGGVGSTRTCTTEDDCLGADVCREIADFDDGCLGRVCMQPCTSQRDCPVAFDCEPLGDRGYCFAYAWEDEYCGSAIGPGAPDFGRACTTDASCGGGVCLDVSLVEDAATGRFCTVRCTDARACETVTTSADCSSIDSLAGRLCVAPEWIEP